MVFQLKVIRAKKMNIKEFRDVILQELKNQGKETEKEYKQTVDTWQGDSPGFESIVDITGGDASVLTGPVGSVEALRKFKWIDEGTRPHIIKARNRPNLAFRVGGFKAKTKVRKIKSGKGSPASGPFVFTKQVMHPGFPAREWTPLIQKRRKPKFTRGMVKAIQRGNKRLYG